MNVHDKQTIVCILFKLLYHKNMLHWNEFQMFCFLYLTEICTKIKIAIYDNETSF